MGHLYGYRVRRYRDLFRDVLVHLSSVKYIIYVSLQSSMTSREYQKIKKYHSFLTVIIIYHKFPAIAWSLAPQSLPNLSLVFWICAVKLLPCLRCYKLEPYFKDSIYFYHPLFSEWNSKNIAHWRSIRLTSQPQPTKHSAPSTESRETSPSTHKLTKAKHSKLTLSFGSNFRWWPASSSLWTFQNLE